MQDQLIGYAEEIITLYRSIAKKFKTQLMNNIENLGFTWPQMMLMHVLHHHPNITLNELSKRLSLSKSTVSGIVDRLEAQGMVSRERPEDNRRTVRISLTSKAVKNGGIKDTITRHFAQALEKLEKEEIESIIYGLKKLEGLSDMDNDEKNDESD